VNNRKGVKMKNKISGGFHRMVHFLVSWLNADSTTSFYPRVLPRWKSAIADWFVVFPWFTMIILLAKLYAS